MVTLLAISMLRRDEKNARVTVQLRQQTDGLSTNGRKMQIEQSIDRK